MIKTLQCFPLSLTCTWSLEPYTICFFMNSLTTLRQVQLLSHVRLFATPWTAARQASLSITNSQSLSRLMSLSQWCRPAISSSAVPFSSCLQSFPASGSFPTSQLFIMGKTALCSRGNQSFHPSSPHQDKKQEGNRFSRFLFQVTEPNPPPLTPPTQDMSQHEGHKVSPNPQHSVTLSPGEAKVN